MKYKLPRCPSCGATSWAIDMEATFNVDVDLKNKDYKYEYYDIIRPVPDTLAYCRICGKGTVTGEEVDSAIGSI